MQLRKFIVRLIPAWDEGTFVCTTPFDTLHQEDVETTSVADLVAKVTAIATMVGKSCQAMVSIADGGRKPRGFEEATKRLYYNLQPQDKSAADAPRTTLSQYAASL